MAKDAGTESAAKTGPSTRTLAALAGLGGVAAMWAVFLWGELLVARSGGTTFCELGGSASCSQLWDGAFASQVHAITRIPVAGWGVIWGVLAMALPLVALIRRDEAGSPTAFVTASRLIGAVGALGVVGLLVVSAAAGNLCIGCLGTYIITGLYALVALYGLRDEGFDEMGGAIGAAAGGTVALALVLLYPGMQTPKSQASQQKDVLKTAAKVASGTNAGHAANDGHGHSAAPTGGLSAPAKPVAPQNPADVTARLRQFFGSIPPPMKQGIADSVGMYKASPVFDVGAPRVVLGGDAKLTITEWTDIRCGHCAQLHEALEEIHKVVPPGSFNVVPRHFPLDGTCNSGIQRRGDGVSCLAAKAQICLEPLGDKLFEYSGKLFKNQQSLTPKMVMDLAKPYMPEDALQKCINSPATEAALKSDVEAALKTNPEGTPVVLINGKKGTGFGAFLFAMIVAGGNVDDPAFQMLPAANPNAHVH